MVIGGIYVDRAATRLANDVCSELREVNGTPDLTDHHVDLAFMTYIPGDIGSDWAEGTGVRAGMVGRKQRRFIIWIEVPPSLPNRDAYAEFVTDALTQAASIVREYLPRKGKTYPWERLAAEVDHLRGRWIAQAGKRT